MRADLEIIQEWIPAGSRVLDLGCGDGELLTWLRDNKQVTGYGLENDADNIAECVAKGINVIEQDLDKGLGNFASNSFRHRGHDPGAASGALPGQNPRRNAAGRPPVHHHLPQFRPLALPLVPGEQGPDAGFRISAVHLVQHTEHPLLHFRRL
jgi:SAM-dependent methyltransferase